MNHELGVNILSQTNTPMVLPIYTGSVITFDVAYTKETVLPVACRYVLYRTASMSADNSLILIPGQKGPLVTDTSTISIAPFPLNYIMLSDDGMKIITYTQGSGGARNTLVFGYA